MDKSSGALVANSGTGADFFRLMSNANTGGAMGACTGGSTTRGDLD